MDLQLLEKLINSRGISGEETEVRELIKQEMKKHVDEVYVDKFGNLVAHKKGKVPRVMLAAHMDEIGLIIKRIGSKGQIVFSTVGGVEVTALFGQRVFIKTKNSEIMGVITSERMSTGDEINALPKITDLYVDTGLSREELQSSGVEIGSYIHFYGTHSYLGDGDFICGKSLDNRLGCYILIELAKLLKSNKNEIFFVFTVQEEIGMFGARTSAYTIDPAWAIAVDVTTTDDVFSTPTRALGYGPCITIKDAAMISNKCINDWLKDIAKKNKIPLQYDVSEYGATDALTISFSRGGIPSTTVAVPVRNIHTTVGIAHKKDIENAIKLMNMIMKKPPLACLV